MALHANVDSSVFFGEFPYLGVTRLHAEPAQHINVAELDHASDGECLAWDEAS